MKLFPGELLKEFPRRFINQSIQFGQHFYSLWGNVRPHHPAVMQVALLAKEFVRFEPGEQPCDIRLGSNHHAPNGRTGKPFRTRPPQNAQHVELSQGEPGRFEPLLHGAVQAIRRAHEVEQRLLLGTGEALGLPHSL